MENDVGGKLAGFPAKCGAQQYDCVTPGSIPEPVPLHSLLTTWKTRREHSHQASC